MDIIQLRQIRSERIKSGESPIVVNQWYNEQLALLQSSRAIVKITPEILPPLTSEVPEVYLMGLSNINTRFKTLEFDPSTREVKFII